MATERPPARTREDDVEDGPPVSSEPDPNAPPPPSSVDAFKALVQSWYNDPLKFCNDVFVQKPREWQPEVLNLIRDHNRLAVKACRKAGKTRTAAYIALWWLVTRPGALVLTTAPTWRQVEKALWVDIRRIWYASMLPRLFPSWQVLQTEIATSPTRPDWRAIGVSSDEPGKIEGFQADEYVLVIYDESKAVPRDIYEACQGMLAGAEWRELAISTPGLRDGWFYEAFTERAESWTTYSISADRIPRLQPDYERKKRDWGANDPSFRQQQKAEFTGAEEGVVISLDSIEQCVGLGFRKEGPWKKTLAIDVAGTGKNETVVAYKYGPVVLRLDCWDHKDEMWTTGNIVQRIRRFQPDVVVVDQTGLGGPIVSRLRELGYEISGFKSGARARNNEEFDNAKTEAAFYLRKLFMEQRISIPLDRKLMGQLASWTTTVTSRGRTRLVDPETSPDRADAVLMAFASDFIKPSVATGSPDFV